MGESVDAWNRPLRQNFGHQPIFDPGKIYYEVHLGSSDTSGVK